MDPIGVPVTKGSIEHKCNKKKIMEDPIYNSFSICKVSCNNEYLTEGRSYSQTNVDISSCFFSRVSQFAGSGGVIYISGGSFTMNSSNTIFYNCVY